MTDGSTPLQVRKMFLLQILCAIRNRLEKLVEAEMIQSSVVMKMFLMKTPIRARIFL